VATVSITFRARIQNDGKIAVPRKLRKKIASKVITVTVTETPAGRPKDIFDEWMRKSPFPAGFKPLSRDALYAGR
jgi:hypothetical protein